MASERRLPNKRKRASTGRVIRVSLDVFNALNEVRCEKTWDAFLRKFLGMPNRRGIAQPLVEGMLEITTGLFLLKLPATTWTELEKLTYKIAMQRLKRSRVTPALQPVRLREIYDQD